MKKCPALVTIVLIFAACRSTKPISIVANPHPEIQGKKSALKVVFLPFEEKRDRIELGNFYTSLAPGVSETYEVAARPDEISRRAIDDTRNRIAGVRAASMRQAAAMGHSATQAVEKSAAECSAEWQRAMSGAFLQDSESLRYVIPAHLAQSMTADGIVLTATFVDNHAIPDDTDVIVRGALLKSRHTIKTYCYYIGLMRYIMPITGLPFDSELVELEYVLSLYVPGKEQPFASFPVTGGGFEFERKLYDGFTSFPEWRDGPTGRLFQSAVEQACLAAMKNLLGAIPYEGATFERIRRTAAEFHEKPYRDVGVALSGELAAALIEAGAIAEPGSQTAIDRVSGTKSDIETMEFFLTFDENGPQIPRDRIVKLTGADVTREAVLSAVRTLAAKTGKDGKIFVYFTGRGAVRYSEETKTLDFALATGQDGSGAALLNPLGLNEIIRLAEGLECRTAVLIDAGFSGDPHGRGTPHPYADLAPRRFPETAVTMMFSCRPDEPAYAEKNLAGVFSRIFTDELKAGAATFEEAFMRTGKKISARTENAQHPVLFCTGLTSFYRRD